MTLVYRVSQHLICAFCAFKTATLASEVLVSMGPITHLWSFACKIATFGSELQVCISPRLRLYGFVNAKQRAIVSRITSLHGSQTSPVLLCMLNSVIRSRMTSCLWVPSIICGFVHAKLRLLDHNYKSLWFPDFACSVCECKTACLRIQNDKLVCWSQTFICRFVHEKQRDYSTRITSLLWVPDLTCRFVNAKQRA